MRLGELWRRFLRPARTIRPTREGWWFLAATFGLGLAAFNTGNNLLYLLVSTLLGLIVVSGVLSEQSMRGLRLTRVTPKDIFAGQTVLLGVVLTNIKRWFSTYSVALESGPGGAGRVSYLPRLEPGQEALVTIEERFPRRGRQRLPGVRIVTRFPFGFFHKASRPHPGEEVLVYPAVRPLTPEDLAGLAPAGAGRERRPGQGTEFHNLREYRWGDDPRLIHWRSSAKADTLLVRELEGEGALAVRVVLEADPVPPEPEGLEAALSRAASLAAHLIGEGAQVELIGPGVHVPLGQGSSHLRRILEALALFEPERGHPAAPASLA
ncbi:MAG: DUF58 domain-containing protein, partial [Candidatus Rokubacteria bacterium]|nr:DUF58 domain-containing protein [Candidatus Rokubacteria bacterium]